jgi:hypothetical protein
MEIGNYLGIWRSNDENNKKNEFLDPQYPVNYILHVVVAQR